MRRLRHLAGQHRTASTNRLLGGLLAFTMGLQNAVVSKISASQIRTTHMTGVITDLGIELGKLLYWNRSAVACGTPVRANIPKLRLLSLPPLCADWLRWLRRRPRSLEHFS
jgi:hypothetical protein